LFFKINFYTKYGLIFFEKFCKLECESARDQGQAEELTGRRAADILCDQGQAEELTGGRAADIL
jgi:hypothetical protein